MTAQDLIVFAIVLAAAVYLGRTLMLSVSGRKSCGSCGSGKKCGSSMTSKTPAAAPPQLIQIGLNGGFRHELNGHAPNRTGPNRENSAADQ